MATKLKHQTGNPESVSNIDQGRGPTAGNEGNAEKRRAFIAAKAPGGEKSQVAAMIQAAFARRGAGMKPNIEDYVEGVHTNTNMGRGPTRGGSGRR
jgi:5-formaminoimidazole-4-carboxamide-1-beta-D-ribofuranosyl 5'-monophosphate synthetase